MLSHEVMWCIIQTKAKVVEIKGQLWWAMGPSIKITWRGHSLMALNYLLEIIGSFQIRLLGRWPTWPLLSHKGGFFFSLFSRRHLASIPLFLDGDMWTNFLSFILFFLFPLFSFSFENDGKVWDLFE